MTRTQPTAMIADDEPLLREAPQCAMRSDPHGAGRLADELRGRVYVEVGDHAQGDDLGLVGRQRAEHIEGPLGAR